MESETGKRFFFSRLTRVRLLRRALPISLLILRKKPTVFQSSSLRVPLAGKRVSLLPGTTCLHIKGALDL